MITFENKKNYTFKIIEKLTEFKQEVFLLTGSQKIQKVMVLVVSSIGDNNPTGMK